MKVAVLDCTHKIEALRQDWHDLLARAPHVSPYLTWEWMSAWYLTHQGQGDIYCLTVRQDDRLVGLAPLFLSRSKDQTLPPGTLGFASTFGHHWGWYLCVVAERDMDLPVAEALLKHLGAKKGDHWHTIKLVRMAPLDPTLPFLMHAAILQDMPIVAQAGVHGMAGPLPATEERFCSWVASANRRKRNRSCLTRLERDHGPVELRPCRTQSELEVGMQELRRLNLEFHAARRTYSNFRDETFSACFFETTRRLWEAGWLQLSLLNCGDTLVAASTDALYANCLFCMQPAYNQEFARYDPGHVLTGLVVAAAIQAGAKTVDLLPGGTYKNQYVSQDLPLIDLHLPTASLRGSWPVASQILSRGLRGSAKALLRRGARQVPSEVESEPRKGAASREAQHPRPGSVPRRDEGLVRPDPRPALRLDTDTVSGVIAGAMELDLETVQQVWAMVSQAV